ncbi:MAG: helix-turn-helix transcriptional regulator [Chitinophagales bacterium]|nr:helix-turn-helix transcriptional regulator [Chitinophagales bacterium]
MSPKSAQEIINVSARTNETALDYALLRKGLLVLRAVNHPVRHKIIDLLERSQKLIVTDLQKRLNVEQSIVSQHLAILRKAGLLQTERNGKFIFYSVNRQRLLDVKTMAEQISV